MDLEQMKKVWEAYLEVQEGKKKLSPAQKKHFDKDNDGDIDDKDMAMLNKEANEPAEPIKGGDPRKGDKKNHDPMGKVVPGDPEKHSKGKMAESKQDPMQKLTPGDPDKHSVEGAKQKKAYKKQDPMQKVVPGDPEKHSVGESLVKFTTFLEKVADEWPYKDEFNFKGKNKPAQDNEPLGQSKTEPNTQEYARHNESSTEPEGLVDKESPKSKEFIRQHQKSDKEFEVKYDQSVDDVSKAGADAVKSQSPNRRGTDQLKNGDMKPFKQAGKG